MLLNLAYCIDYIRRVTSAIFSIRFAVLICKLHTTHIFIMFGGPGGQPSDEQKKLQERYAIDTLKTAGLIAGALWITPVIFHFIRKQL